jgi:hypothetical protein
MLKTSWSVARTAGKKGERSGVLKLVLVDEQEPARPYTHLDEDETSRLPGPAFERPHGLAMWKLKDGSPGFVVAHLPLIPVVVSSA